jgi:hypothetical protein
VLAVVDSLQISKDNLSEYTLLTTGNQTCSTEYKAIEQIEAQPEDFPLQSK